jgi:hypothetical protein
MHNGDRHAFIRPLLAQELGVEPAGGMAGSLHVPKGAHAAENPANRPMTTWTMFKWASLT